LRAELAAGGGDGFGARGEARGIERGVGDVSGVHAETITDVALRRNFRSVSPIAMRACHNGAMHGESMEIA
jgi:hypothetical protein